MYSFRIDREIRVSFGLARDILADIVILNAHTLTAYKVLFNCAFIVQKLNLHAHKNRLSIEKSSHAFPELPIDKSFGPRDEKIHTKGVDKDYLHVQNLPRKPLKFPFHKAMI